MTTLKLGVMPLDLTVSLALNADFITTLRNTSGDWPIGVSCELRFDDPDTTVWAATVVDDEIRFNVDKAQVNTLIAAQPNKARLFYVDALADLLWADGWVSVSA